MKSFIVILLVTQIAFGASHYFDPELGSGANDGTSWANAWRTSGAINWGNVNPGDTFWLSGGVTEKVYTNNLLIVAEGSHNAYVRVRLGQDANHNGLVRFTNATLGPSGANSQWVWIDGSRDDNFIAPTNHQQVISGSTAITNNIGIVIENLVGTIQSDNDPLVWGVYSKPDSLRFSWIEIRGLTNTGGFANNHLRGTVCSIDSGSASAGGTNNIWEYLYLHDNAGQQFTSTSTKATNYNNFTYRFLYIVNGGEDHFELGSGSTIHDCVIGPVSGTSGHADLFQFTGNYFRVYNNDIRESMNGMLRYQTQGEGYSHSFQFFNNIIAEKPGRAAYGGTRNEYMVFVHWDPQITNGAFFNGYSNLLIANNLFYNSISNTFGDPGYGVGPPEMARTAAISMGLRTVNVSNRQIVASIVMNNLFVDKEKGVSFPGTTNTYPTNGWFTYTTNDLLVDYNIFAATNSILTTPRQVLFLDEDIMDGSSTYSFENNTNYPIFVDKANSDFELQDSDTVALNTGYNLSAYFNFDALNRPRNIGGAWDRGPLELQNDGLVIFLPFDNDTPGGNAIDESGNGYHGVKFYHTLDSYPTNRAIADIAGSVIRTSGTGNAADFLYHTNNNTYGFYMRDGGYYGITNAHNILSNITELTVMCWARYNSAVRVHAGADFTIDQAATLISGGGTASGDGGWNLGRYTQDSWLNNTRFLVKTNAGFTGSFGAAGDRTFGDAGNVVFNYPDRGFDNNGDTTNWHHYAFTFSNGIGIAYFDGVPYGTNDMSANITALKLGHSASRPYDWIGIGGQTHVGTPEYDDETGEDYPNYGFMNGGIDQVRIYTVAKSHQQIVNIANSEGASFADAPSAPESSGVATNSIVLQGKLQIDGKVIIQ